MIKGVDVTDLGASLATLVVAAAAFVQSWRAARASRATKDAAEPVRDAVAPVDGAPSLAARLDAIEQHQEDARRVQLEAKAVQVELRRAVDRVENDVATHLQLHTFMGAVRQRWAPDDAPRRRVGDAADDHADDHPHRGQG